MLPKLSLVIDVRSESSQINLFLHIEKNTITSCLCNIQTIETSKNNAPRISEVSCQLSYA